MSGNTRDTTVGVLGGGVMGETLIAGIHRTGREVWVAEKNPERAEQLAARYHVHVASVEDVVEASGVVLIVVKPQDVPDLLAQIAGCVDEGSTIVSLAAGVRTETIEAALPAGATVLRVMPNTPALVAQGMFAVSTGSSVADRRLDQVVRMLSDFGKVTVVGEPLQDAVTAVSGSGPAYVFYLAEQMIAAGIDEGLDPATARLLTVQTIAGSAALLASCDDSPQDLRHRVTSPGGTTFAATSVFDETGVDVGLRKGVRAAAARSAELSGRADQ